MFIKKWLRCFSEFDRAYTNNRIQRKIAEKQAAKFFWDIAQRSTLANPALLAEARAFILEQESTNPNWRQWCQEWQQCNREIV